MLVGERAVAYLNCDSGVVFNQVLKIGASPLMYNLIYESAKLVGTIPICLLRCLLLLYSVERRLHLLTLI